MIILGIETSCDETAAAVLTDNSGRIQILSNVVASSAKLQAKYGGIIPEQAAREQLKSIIPVIQEALLQSNLYPQASNFQPPAIDAIAVTVGPGLIGSLLVGVETAKTLALIWNKPLIAVNHLLGHFYANWITSAAHHLPGVKAHLGGPQVPKFPCLGLLVSGGHTDLVLFENHHQYKYLGGTRDDAAGECFDKCARLLSLPYPGGPAIAAAAAKLKVKNEKIKIKLPRPLIKDQTFDFSFSGLKTAVWREVERLKTMQQFNNLIVQQLSYEVQQAIVDVLVDKTIKAAQKYQVKNMMVAGGVAANQKLTFGLKLKVKNEKIKIKLHIPKGELCTDNAAMIASAAFFERPLKAPLTLQADPSLALST